MELNFWQGKTKAVTFSFDDGVIQDIRAIEILNKYGLKSTFNINSGLLGIMTEVVSNNKNIPHQKVSPKDFKNVYKGHEVAVHTLTHARLVGLDEDVIIHQVENDRKILSDLCGYEVVGMAYPCGGVNNDDRVAQIIREKTEIKYSRTITSTYNFDLQQNLLRFNPSIHFADGKLFDLVEEFINLKTKERKLFYIWGHTYEMDSDKISWEKFEELCRMISGKEDIFYGTNKEVLL